MSPARTNSAAPGARGVARVVSAERRLRARRRARRRRAIRPAVVVASLVTVVVGAGWTALGSSMFALRDVTVKGTSRLAPAAVVAAAHAPEGRSLFLVDPATVERRVDRLPAVASAVVTRHWPHALLITVTERRPVAAVATAGGVELLDASGVAFATAPAPPPGLVPVQLDAALPGAGAPDARAAMQVLSALPPGLRRQISRIRASSPDDVSFQLGVGRTVVWGSPADSAAKLAALQALLRHRPAHTYDVSAPGVAVTR